MIASNRVAADRLVLRLPWDSRHHAGLLSSALLRDYYLHAELPPPGCILSLRLLDEVLVRLDILVVFPMPSLGTIVTCTEKTEVLLIPALPPSLSSERLLDPSPQCYSEGSELPALIRLGLHGNPLLERTGLAPSRSFLVTGEYSCGKTSAVASSAYAAGAHFIRASACDVLRTVATEDGKLHAMRYYMRAARAAQPAVLLLDDVQFLFPPDDDDAAAAFIVVMDEERAQAAAKFVIVLGCSTNAESVHRRVAEATDVLLPLALDPEGRTAVAVASKVKGRFRELSEGRGAFGNVKMQAGTIQPTIEVVGDRRPTTTEKNVGTADAIDRSRTERLIKSWVDMSGRLGGLEEPQKILKRVFLWRQTKAHTFAELGVKPSVGVLLYGCPGTGKTALIRQAASAAQFKIIPVSAASLARGEIGASERLLSQIFKNAHRSSPCVVFMDEIDALFATATATSPHLVRLVAALSLLMDNLCKDVIVIGATNRPWMVSAGLLRPGRFEHCVKVSLPNSIERGQIAAVYAAKMQLQSHDRHCFENLLRSTDAEGLSGADIAGLSRRAVMASVCRGSKIEIGDLKNAFNCTVPSVSPAEAVRLESWNASR